MNSPLNGIKGMWGTSRKLVEDGLLVGESIVKGGSTVRRMAIHGGVGAGIGAAAGIGTSYGTGDGHAARDGIMGGVAGGLLGAGWAGRGIPKAAGEQWKSVRQGAAAAEPAAAVAASNVVHDMSHGLQPFPQAPVKPGRAPGTPFHGTTTALNSEFSRGMGAGEAIPGSSGSVWSSEADGVASYSKFGHSGPLATGRATPVTITGRGSAPMTLFKDRQLKAWQDARLPASFRR